MKEIELKELRRKREKHFLQENGDIIAQVYCDDIHYLKDGKYEEIDNTLVKENDYYRNKNNDYQVYFKDRSSTELMSLVLGNQYLYMNLENSNPILPQVDNHIIRYPNLLEGIDFEYQLLGSKIKENIILKSKESLTEKLIFHISTNLDLMVVNHKIQAIKNNRVIFTMDNPYMIDDVGNQNHNIYYELVKRIDGYQIKLVLDDDWLKQASYPITIDPTIMTGGEGSEVYDTYIYPGDTNVDRNNRDILKVGVEKINDKEVVNRALIKFDLPTIGTGSQVIDAQFQIIGYESLVPNHSEIINVHEITSDWKEETANWNTMNDKYNERIEASFESHRSQKTPVFDENGNLNGYTISVAYNGGDITNLVKKWYEDEPNYGILLKANKEIDRDNVVPAFYSKSAGSPKPFLVIRYRNQNGIESYMHYQTQNFTEGSTYFNTYNGNLTGIFHLGNTIGGKYPASLSLVYNTNDVILNSNGITNMVVGLGTRFNVSQTIEEETIDSMNYLKQIDADGTIHYFYEVTEDNSTYYQDEDGLNMTIRKTDTEYIVTDKVGNKMKFTIDKGVGYFSEILDVSGNKNTMIYDTNHRVIKIVDANESEIHITYEENKITVESPNETVVLYFTDNKLIRLESKQGTTTFTYGIHHTIETITDSSGQKIKYEYYDQSPYRIKKITEYGLQDTLGQYFSVIYGFQSTTLLDYKGRPTIMTYNQLGNLISTSNLNHPNDLKSAYGMVQEYGTSVETERGEESFHKNKLLSSGIPLRYVKNYFHNSSFEEEDLGFVTDSTNETEIAMTRSTERANSGTHSLKVVCSTPNRNCHQEISIPKGKNYTLSTYCCGTGKSSMKISYQTTDSIETKTINIENGNDEFIRQELFFYYPEEAISDITISFDFWMQGTYYIDDIQLEEGEVANKYNLLENSDFSNNLEGWDIGAVDYDSILSDGSYEDVTNQVFSIVPINELGDKALKVKMNPSQGSYFSKTYQVNGKKGETYGIHFWYKDEGFYASGIVGDDIRNNVTISYEYLEDTDNGHCTVASPTFNPNDTDWQYYSASFVAERDFKSLTLYFDQEHNANSFYITNLYLLKDLRENYFEYDEKDNLKSVVGLDKEKSQYRYDGNNQLIKMVYPKGDKFTYEYDNQVTDRVIGGISESGLGNHMKYDSFGNLVVTKIKQVGSTPIAGKNYQIRAKGTRNYIRCIAKSLSVTSDDCGHDKWSLEKVDDNYCRIQYPILDNKYLGKVTNTLSIVEGIEKSSEFQLIRRNNNSYYLKLKGDNPKPEITKDTIEAKLDIAIQREMTVVAFFDGFVEENLVSYPVVHRHLKQAKENDILSDSMMSMVLSQLLEEKPSSKTDLIGIAYETLNDEESPLYVHSKGNIIELSPLVENDSSFEFYFEDTENQLFLEGSSTYTEDGKFITSMTDTNLNTVYYDINTTTGLLSSMTDAKGNTTHYTYDTKDRPTSITRGTKQIQYTYNEHNQLSSILGEKESYHFVYDNFGNNKQVKIGDNITLVTNHYEENNGNLKSVTYGNQDTISYTYDEFDRIKSALKEDNTYQYHYDNNGDLVKVISNQEEINYQYDLSKKLNRYRCNNFKIYYDYDKNNNIIQKKYHLDSFIQDIRNTYNEENLLTETAFDNHKIHYQYDKLGRLKNRNIDNQFHTNYEYVTHGNRTSLLVKSIENNNDKYSYRYDEGNNITHIYHNGILEKKYQYDNDYELLEEKDYVTNKKTIYLYDNAGNILSKKYYSLLNGNLLSEDEYEYHNSNWKDQLSSFNGISITYDEIGNPLTIGNQTFTWMNGRQLNSYSDDNVTIQYQYNGNGIRTSKTVNGVETKYDIEGTKIIFEQTGNNVIYYIRNGIDNLIGFCYNSDKYYYIKNNLEDIIGILDNNYNVVARYTYDSWGNMVSITDSNGIDISNQENHIANINPFRYRSYYYDRETGFYYLNSRYYNPNWGRFLNADGIIGANGDILSNNLYLYCSNNPAGKKDSSGLAALNWAECAVNGINAVEATIKQVIRAQETEQKTCSLSVTPNLVNVPDLTDIVKASTKNVFNNSLNNVSSKMSLSFGFQKDLYVEFLGVPLGVGGGLYNKYEITDFSLRCYSMQETSVGFIIGKKKYYETEFDCNSGKIISERVYKHEVLIGPIRIDSDNNVYLEFSQEAGVPFFKAEAGITIGQ